LADSQNTSAGLSQLKSLADTASQLAATASSTTGTQGMQAAATQVNQLLEQAVSAGNSTSGGNYLFAGTALSTAPFTVTRDPTSGQITSVAYAGSANSVSVPLGDGSSVQPGTDATTNTALATFMNQLVTLRNSLQSGDSTSAQATATPLADSDDTIVGAISDQAAVQSRIQIAQTRQQTQLTNLGQDISTATAVDMPTAITKLNLASEAYQAALESAAKFMNVSLLNYIH
jgi:flagellar hook-associated protein 3 FlgL